jgi:hypothetical protein
MTRGTLILPLQAATLFQCAAASDVTHVAHVMRRLSQRATVYHLLSLFAGLLERRSGGTFPRTIGTCTQRYVPIVLAVL